MQLFFILGEIMNRIAIRLAMAFGLLALPAGAATLGFDTAADCTTPGVHLTAGYADTFAGACDIGSAPGGSNALVRSDVLNPGNSFWAERLDSAAGSCGKFRLGRSGRL